MPYYVLSFLPRERYTHVQGARKPLAASSFFGAAVAAERGIVLHLANTAIGPGTKKSVKKL
jgi:hypothetical protein